MDTSDASICQPSKKQVTSAKRGMNANVLSDLEGEINEYVIVFTEDRRKSREFLPILRNKLRAVIEE